MLVHGAAPAQIFVGFGAIALSLLNVFAKD